MGNQKGKMVYQENKFAIIPAEDLKPLIDAAEALIRELSAVGDRSELALKDTSQTLRAITDAMTIHAQDNHVQGLDTFINSLVEYNLQNRVEKDDLKEYINVKFDIFINILKIIVQRLNMAAVRELEKPLYKIKNMDTGMYSTGGTKPGNVTKTGKVWNSLGEVRKHLALFNPETGRYSEGNWVVMAIDGIESPSFSVKSFYE